MTGTAAPAEPLTDALSRRREAGERFFRPEAARIARLCHAMAARFARGGRLIAGGATALDRSDVRHVTVEFVHPVIVGKRALPALGLTLDGGPLDHQTALLVEPEDIFIAFGRSAAGPGVDPRPLEALRHAVWIARERGALTLAFSDAGAEWELAPPSPDPFIAQELVETLYHVLWELVHVFFEHRGLLPERTARHAHDPGASAFLYPFLEESENDLDAVLEDVRRSVVMKADEAAELRRRMLESGHEALIAAAAMTRDALDDGGRVLAFGNGGSATDATDAVADLRIPPRNWPPRPAIDLTEDSATLTALANDIGPDAIFARQIIACGRDGDVALAFSTSGDSRNVVRALQEARSRGIRTIALLGYDGGRIAAERLADHVIVAPSQHIPRIQEAHATAWHLLRERIEAPAPPVASAPEHR